MIKYIKIILVCLIFIGFSPARATIVELSFNGNVRLVTQELAGEVTPLAGDQFSGIIRYDSSIIPGDVGSSGAVSYSNALTFFDLTSTSFSWTSSVGNILVENDADENRDMPCQAASNTCNDDLRITSLNLDGDSFGEFAPFFMQFNLTDEGTFLNRPNGISDSLLPIVFNFTNFSGPNEISISFQPPNLIGGGSIDATITSLTTTLIPIPTAIWLIFPAIVSLARFIKFET